MRRFISFNLIVFLCIGCSQKQDDTPALAKISGVITLDGKPLQKANVTFLPKQVGTASFGVTDEQGKYLLNYSRGLSGAVIGSHRVMITTGGEKMDEDGEIIEEFPELLPDKYHANSELTADVPEGGAEINFELSTK